MTSTSLRSLSTRFTALAVCLFAFWAAPARAQLTPSADSYTNTASPGTNYGAQKLLDVESSQTTYIQFDLSSIPAGYTGSSVAKASLKLYVNAVTTTGSFNVDYVNGSWAENTITANLAPALGTTIAASVPLSKSAVHDYILIDITPAVGAWLDGTQANDGISLVGNSSFSATFDSKENTTNSHPPELDIVFAGGGGSGITGINTGAGSGLQGGGSSGTLNLSLVTSCASGQILEWNGSAWACASLSGGGTITGVTAGTDLTGGGSSGTVTLNVDTTKVPQLNSPNTFSGNQTVNGDLSATGLVTGSAFNIGSNLFAFGSIANSNAFLGFSGNTTTTGKLNTTNGALALVSNTTGGGNTASGYQALVANTSGGENTASGEFALEGNTTGFSNTATGGQALQSNNTGMGNTADGVLALNANTLGNNNTATGDGALVANITGSNNTAFGYNAGPDSGHPNLTNATAIGANSVVNASNALVLGGTGANAVNVGIGTATPAATLDVHGTGSFTGLITFAAGQTFPGAGTITGVTAGTDLIGGGTGGSVTLSLDTTKVVTGVTAGTDLTGGGTGGVPTLSLDTTKVPQLNAANMFTGNQTTNGNLTATGVVSSTSYQIGNYPFAFGSATTFSAYLGFAGFSPNTNTASYNTAIGFEALGGPSTGGSNTAVGAAAMFNDVGGINNSALGANALLDNQGGSNNTAVGYQALWSSGGSSNTAAGFNAGQPTNGFVTSGSNNSFLGAGTTTGTQLALNNATAIGAQAEVDLSNALVLGSINGVNSATADTSVGIGTSAPSSTLDVEGSAAAGSGPILLFKNKAAIATGTTGNAIDLRFAPDGGSNVVNPNAYIRVREDGSSQYGAFMSFATMPDGGAGSGALERVRIAANGFVGIGVSSPVHIFQVGQGLGAAYADSWTTYSSRRWKTNIHTLPNALAKVEQLRGVSYDLKGSGKHEIGVIAEEVGEVVPEVVSYEENGKDAQGVDYSRLTALLIEATKQQQSLIRQQQKQIAAQQAQIAHLASQVRTIKAAMRTPGRSGSEVRVTKAPAARIQQ